MKNLFKFGFLALAISFTFAACNSSSTEESTTDTIDSVSEVSIDSLENEIDTVDSASDAAIDSVQN